MLIEECLIDHARRHPDKPALIAGERVISYAELLHRIRLAADFYRQAGLQKGDRVVLSAAKCADFVFAYFGAHLAGLIGVPIDPETNPTRLERIEECARPSMFVGELRHAGQRTVRPFADITSTHEADITLPSADAIADILFTTGTTGQPKGVALSFRNQQAAAEQINAFVGTTADDVELLALPISHSFGLGRLRCVLSRGATLVLLGSFAGMKKFYAEIERCHVTGFGMVPGSWNYIRKMSGERLARYADQLKYIEIGSAFMPEAEKRKLMQMLPHTRICMHYGLTEASRSAFLSFHDDEPHLMSVGRPAPGTEVAVFDSHGHEVPQGSEGEIGVAGRHVCAAYWGRSREDFRRDFYGNFFRTGDWGYIDDEGYIHLKSRIKEIINVGGKKVSPVEVEEVLNTMEGITETACIAAGDNVLGEVVKAFIVGSLTADDDDAVRKYATAHLENYKVPAIIEHVNSLPKTASGKLQRLLLK